MIDWPGDADAGPVFVIDTSALCVTAVETLAVLFPGTGSLTPVAETLALFETEPVAVVAIEYVLTIVALWPAASEANEHG